MEVALVRNRVDFVKLLLETGCYMKTFVTTKRLEHLYSSIENMVHLSVALKLGWCQGRIDIFEKLGTGQ